MQAIFWIRDGVLVDRMHVNPVAFAAAVLLHAGETRRAVSLCELINFGFSASGISCADKIKLFNQKKFLLPDHAVAAAAQTYNELATETALSCGYFSGTLEMLQSLKESGIKHFITSAVEQELIDAWLKSDQGKKLAPLLTEALGKRSDICEGREHFAYAREKYALDKIYYVADAVSEIAAGSQLKDLNVVTIGFSHVITAQRVSLALDMVQQAALKLASDTSTFTEEQAVYLSQLELQQDELILPNEASLDCTLRSAGADHLVAGDSSTIVGRLNTLWQQLKLIS